MKVLVTGGAGFIGSAVVRYLIRDTRHAVVNFDKLTYAGNLDSLEEVVHDSRYSFERGDVADTPALDRLLNGYQPDVVMHLAAESHVDRSIDGPGPFIQTNVVGTYSLLRAAQRHWERLPAQQRSVFRFHHVSTDEVYGDNVDQAAACAESASYAPSSPYAASKAAGDHLVRAWHRTFGLPVVISNCSNNYGPYQFPEKLIPHMVLNALQYRRLPVYGDGRQVRDWLHVEDHVRGLLQVLAEGRCGETYNIGGGEPRQNIAVVQMICDLLDELAPGKRPAGTGFRDLIDFVADRPGHDRRYAIDTGKITRELGWQPRERFESGLRKTVHWYLDNRAWWQRVLNGDYRLERAGL